MILTIDLSKKEPELILKKGREETASQQWPGLYQLSETILPQIDKLLKKNKIKLVDLKEIKVIPSKESLVSTRIAKAVALGLKID